MPSRSFVVQKIIGREFETAMIPVLEQAGMRVIDVDSWAYKYKKGVDVIVEVKGVRCGIEFKYDKMSEKTGNVVIDLDSLGKTTAGIWIYGFKRGDFVDTYSMRTTELSPFAFNWPVRKPVGEFRQLAAFMRKEQFLSQPFVFKFKTINLG